MSCLSRQARHFQATWWLTSNRIKADTPRKKSEQRQRQSSTKALDKPKHRSGGTVRNMLTSPAPSSFQRLPFQHGRKSLPHAQQHKQARTQSCKCNSKLDCTIFKFSTIVKRGKKISMVSLRSIFAVKVGCTPEKHFEIQGSARQEADLQTLLP